MQLKPVKGFFGGPKPVINSDVFDDMGMEDGGLFVLTISNKKKQVF